MIVTPAVVVISYYIILYYNSTTKIVYDGHPTPPIPPAYIHTTLFARIFSVPRHAKYATTMMSTTGRAQMVAVRYTRARTRQINSLTYTHTHARAKRHTDTAAARRRQRRRKQRTQHVTTTYERSPRLRLYESLTRSHSPREATHCWAETRRTDPASCPLSRKAAVTLKRGPRCYDEGATGSTYEHTMRYERARNRVRVRVRMLRII